MKQYVEYFKYIIEHKKNVFKEAWKAGMYIHAFTHDLSKFYPSEFFAYADYFYKENGQNSVIGTRNFEHAWQHHQNRNRHHWDYWVDGKGIAVPMPIKYVRQMIVNWSAMGVKFGDTANAYYDKTGHDMNIHNTTRYRISNVLKGLNV